MFCPKCGFEEKTGSLFCSFCGTKLTANEALSQNTQKENSDGFTSRKSTDSDKIILLATIIALVTVVVVGGLFAAKKLTGKSAAQLVSEAVSGASEKNMQEKTSVNNPVILKTEESSTSVPTTFTTTEAFSETTTTAPVTEDDFPQELQKYRSGMVKEGRNYKISLQEENWNILFRSEPRVTKFNDTTDDNRICKISDGTIIYVEYIYNDIWAVFQYNGQWGFSSMYAGADRNQRLLMYPV